MKEKTPGMPVGKKAKAFVGRHALKIGLGLAAGAHLGTLYHEEASQGAKRGLLETRRVFRQGEAREFEAWVQERLTAADEGKEKFDFKKFYPTDEYVTGKTSSADQKEALANAEKLIVRLKASAAAEQNRLKVLHEFLQIRRKVDYTSGLATDFLNGGGSDCEQMVKVGLIVLPEVYPDMPFKIQHMLKGDMPHVRLIANVQGTWYGLDENTPYPLKPRDFKSVVTFDPVDLIRARLGEPIDGRQGFRSAVVNQPAVRTQSSGGPAGGAGGKGPNPPSIPLPSTQGFAPQIAPDIKIRSLGPKKSSFPLTYKQKITFDKVVSPGASAPQGAVISSVNFEQAQASRATAAIVARTSEQIRQTSSRPIEVTIDLHPSTLKERMEKVKKDSFEVEFRDKLAKEHGFSYVSPFTPEGIAMAEELKGGSFLIERDGAKMAGPYDEIHGPTHGIFLAKGFENPANVGTQNRTNTAFSYFTAKGKKIFSGIGMPDEFEGGLGVFRDRRGVYCIVDRDGNARSFPNRYGFRKKPQLQSDGTLWIPIEEVDVGVGEDLFWTHIDPDRKRIGSVQYISDKIKDPLATTVHVMHGNGQQESVRIDKGDGKKVEWHLIKPDGTLSENGYWKIGPFLEDRAVAIIETNKSGQPSNQYIIDREGEIVAGPLTPQIAHARWRYSNGFLQVVDHRGQEFFLDREGEKASPDYDDVNDFSEGKAKVTKRGSVFYVDTTFKKLGPEREYYGFGTDFHNERAIVNHGMGRPLLMIDEMGKVIAPLEVDHIPGGELEYNHDGLWNIRDRLGRMVYFDKNGKQIFK
ncbi:hypothetical protein EXS71_01220 [Candidatus Uhrbacteria bacterium]|nr:hypothetical protein [Candidatus Uhrbacteria bacterium]